VDQPIALPPAQSPGSRAKFRDNYNEAIAFLCSEFSIQQLFWRKYRVGRTGRMNIRLETALVFLVPEAQALVAAIRERHDPSAAAGMPAHITLLYPFVAPSDVDDSVIHKLRRCLIEFAAFRYSLCGLRQFPGYVLYLVPEPEEPFRRLTSAISSCFPQTPPYADRHRDIVPHLTLGHFADAEELEDVARAFTRSASAELPIQATAARVSVMDSGSGGWRVHTELALGQPGLGSA
jgi:2'-5' RNA ligase